MSVPDVVDVLGDVIQQQYMHGLAMQDQRDFVLNVLGLLGSTGIDWTNEGSSNIETFSFVLLLLLRKLSKLQLAIAKYHQTLP